MTGHGVYDDGTDPGPAPGSVPACPMCGVHSHRPPPAMTEITNPPGWWCTGCDTFVPPAGGTVTAKQRDLHAASRRDRSHDSDEAA